jgi:hypothetical protein
MSIFWRLSPNHNPKTFLNHSRFLEDPVTHKNPIRRVFRTRLTRGTQAPAVGGGAVRAATAALCACTGDRTPHLAAAAAAALGLAGLRAPLALEAGQLTAVADVKEGGMEMEGRVEVDTAPPAASRALVSTAGGRGRAQGGAETMGEGVELVGSHGRWKRPCLQTAHMAI